MALPPSSAAGAEILPRRQRATRRLVVWVSTVAAVLLVASAGGAAAAARFDARHGSEFLPGVTVHGVPVGGMELEDAYRLLARSIEDPLDRVVTVHAGDESFPFTPRELGADTDLRRQLKEAADLQRTMPLTKRIWHRLTGNPVEARYQVTTSLDDTDIGAFVDRIAPAVESPARDAAPELGTGDTLRYRPGVPGRKLDRDEAVRRIFAAMREGDGSVNLEVTPVPPAVPEGGHPHVIVVKVGDNKLLHFQAGQLVKAYDVATGSRKYATPKGLFRVVNKRFRPTWVNPAKGKGEWGANLPARIGPGPGNPLGTRAMDLNVGGIRIHGSSNTRSIGYNASHGCIRMHMPDVEELFELVGLGTPVLIVQTAELRSGPVAAPPTIEDLAEADGTVIPGVTPAPVPAVPPVPAPEPATPGPPPQDAASPTPTPPAASPSPTPEATIPDPNQPVAPAPAG
jgi:lipoprotein-anchoring transpeptidase ErfK/SrfK